MKKIHCTQKNDIKDIHMAYSRGSLNSEAWLFYTSGSKRNYAKKERKGWPRTNFIDIDIWGTESKIYRHYKENRN